MTEKVFTCSKCNATFQDEKYLKRHLNKNIPCDREHKCNKCGTEFQTAQILRKHKNRKSPCVPDEVPVISEDNSENRCLLCNKTFSSASNLKRHQKTCNLISNPAAALHLMKMLEDIKTQNNALVKENAHLKEANVTNINNNNLTVNQNLYVNVTICNFGSEDLSRLKPEEVIELLRGRVEDFMTRMIEHIHANPKYPEFHNVFFDPTRKKALVYGKRPDDKSTWLFGDIEHISKQITDKIKDHVHPLNGPYFNMLAQSKDIETANKIPQILCTNWNTPVVVEGAKESLTKVTKNEGFMDQVTIME